MIEAQAPLRRAPSHDAPLDTEALKGERVTVYETNEEGWAWGQLESDRYVGWLPANALAPLGPRSDPQGRRVAHARLSGPVDQTAADGDAAARRPPGRRAHAGPVRRDGRRRLSARPASGAARRSGATTSSRSPNCSSARPICGAARPARARLLRPGADGAGRRRHCLPARQRHAGSGTGQAVALDRRCLALRRGDLVFWDGHVAIVRDGATLAARQRLHMAVAVEPIARGDGAHRSAGGSERAQRQADRAQ